MAYKFVLVHRPGHTMRDMDGLNRGSYYNAINDYGAMAYMLMQEDKLNHPLKYCASTSTELLPRGKHSLKGTNQGGGHKVDN